MSKSVESRFKAVNPQNDFPKMEETILEFWESNDIYNKTQNLRSKGKPYTWLEGPPTANNVPHAGHALTRTLKDIMLRYQTMKGRYVIPRIGGWDCHGLPVELEIEKTMGFNSKNDIEEYGIEKFNNLCRESVLKYTNEWVEMSKRIGFWLDLENSYVTMTDEYIESVWWSLKTLYEKDLVFKGTRVAPYCARCGTTLSSHELAQGYKEVEDPALFVKFKSIDFDDVSYIAWTTTPWTLLANVMLTVHPNLEYAIVEYEGEKLLMAKELITKVLTKLQKGKKKTTPKYKVLKTMRGKELEGKKYEPIFPFFKDIGGNAFQVTLAEYVTVEDGSGIVHSAPAFGADDAETGNRYGAPVLKPVGLDGKFTSDVPPLQGMWVKDADKKIIKMLKEENKLFIKEVYKHNYPHCWRCDTVLLYYGTESWFISMSKLRTNLVNCNDQIFWQPNYLKEGRFGNFISNAVDWNLSRSRYWGTPLPVWICTDCKKVEFIGSKQELVDKVNELPENFELHRPWVDEVNWQCNCGGKFIREEYVIDTWYDSGAAPFAQLHYPFENKDMFEKYYPYSWITEAIDQTRGWFYSLLAVGTALFDRPAFMSVLCMNHVLAEDGSKMSKSKGNTIEPKVLFNFASADATRWYLSATPAWNPNRFGKNLVRDAQRRVLNTLWNVYSFFTTYITMDNYDPSERTAVSERPEIDQWIISRLQNVIMEVDKGLEEITFHLSTKVLDYFIVEELSNWYVRRSRRRFYGGELTDEKRTGYDTLFEVLTTVAKLMAPFTPYLSEEIYQNLELAVTPDAFESVHMNLLPRVNKKLIRSELERKMELVLSITQAARSARSSADMKARQPLSELLISLNSDVQLEAEFLDVIKEEINVKSLQILDSDDEYVEYQVQPMLKVLAPVVKGAITEIKSHLENLTRAEAKGIVHSITRTGKASLNIGDDTWEFNSEELLVNTKAAEGFAMGDSRDVSVFLNINLTDELRQEGLVRGMIRYIQDERKQADLDYLDKIKLEMSFTDKFVKDSFEKYQEYIKEETQSLEVEINTNSSLTIHEIDGFEIGLKVKKLR
ncbi:MAG: isoleucine--tRNA ligase [Candidatus Heimdallarchaeota archaeon]|nr:isoleucine--tRNA ligase [Candidatus Heimdallarchaeota archaeon]